MRCLTREMLQKTQDSLTLSATGYIGLSVVGAINGVGSLLLAETAGSSVKDSLGAGLVLIPCGFVMMAVGCAVAAFIQREEMTPVRGNHDRDARNFRHEQMVKLFHKMLVIAAMLFLLTLITDAKAAVKGVAGTIAGGVLLLSLGKPKAGQSQRSSDASRETELQLLPS